MIVLDTHSAIWWTTAPQLLSQAAAEAIATANSIGIPSIVFWEVSLLVRKGKLDLGMPVVEWAEKVQAIPRVRSLPLTPAIAMGADDLDMLPDLADRFIVGSTIIEGARLVSKDRLLRSLTSVEVVW